MKSDIGNNGRAISDISRFTLLPSIPSNKSVQNREVIAHHWGHALLPLGQCKDSANDTVFNDLFPHNRLQGDCYRLAELLRKKVKAQAESRLDLVFAIVRRLDAMIFNGSGMIDKDGAMILDSDGSSEVTK
jgi:hypothetical protein